MLWDVTTVLDKTNTKVVAKDLSLPVDKVASFKDGQYDTIELTKAVTLYRVWGQTDSGAGATKIGGFLSTFAPKNKIQAKLDFALLPEWKNTKAKVTAWYFPPGVKLNKGIAAPQSGNYGTFLPGGAEQLNINPSDFAKLVEDGIVKPLGEMDLL